MCCGFLPPLPRVCGRRVLMNASTGKDRTMDIGFVGLGKMGGNMALRWTVGSADGTAKGGHRVFGFAKDQNPDLINIPGIEILSDLGDMVHKLTSPRVVWVMVPAGNVTESVITQLADLLSEGDILI